jgi:hypothetical protein
LADGSEIVGPLENTKFSVQLQGKDHPIDLKKLESIKIIRKAANLPPGLSIEAVVMLEGKVIARQQIDLVAHENNTYSPKVASSK